MSVPAPILGLMFGEFANEGLLSSCRAHPPSSNRLAISLSILMLVTHTFDAWPISEAVQWWLLGRDPRLTQGKLPFIG